MSIKVKCDRGENLERVLKRFKKQCEKEGLIKDIKKNMFYEKPSEKRRRKRRAAIQRALKEDGKLPGQRGRQSTGGRGDGRNEKSPQRSRDI